MPVCSKRPIRLRARFLAMLSCALIFPLATRAQLKINEFRYNVTPQGGNQYVELYNAGGATEYLDGKILTDSELVDPSDTEGVFKFPGAPGQMNFPVLPGGFVLIAVDAFGATSNAQWECFAGGGDTNNLLVPDLVLIHGSQDLSLLGASCTLLLADGTQTNPPIAQSTFIDGVNYGLPPHPELVPLSATAADNDPNLVSSTNNSLNRCPDGSDDNVSSASDFISLSPTPAAANGGCNALPSFSINDVAVPEGNAGFALAVFSVTLSAASATNVSVNVATAPNSAAAGVDFVSASNTLIFPPGVTSTSVTIQVVGDVVTESNETFFVFLTAPSNAVIADGAGLGTIIDDEGGAAISVNNTSVTEGNSGTVTARFHVTLSFPVGSAVYVNAFTSNGTARSGSDYTAVPVSLLTFPPSSQTQVVGVVISGDALPEFDEGYSLRLQSPTNAILADGQGDGLILNDDAFALAAISNAGQTLFATWQATTGILYQAQSTTNLIAPAWQNVSGVVTALNIQATAPDTNKEPGTKGNRVLQLSTP